MITAKTIAVLAGQGNIDELTRAELIDALRYEFQIEATIFNTTEQLRAALKANLS